MNDDQISTDDPLVQDELTAEQLAAICCVEDAWVMTRVELGLFPQAHQATGAWRLPSSSLQRARRMRQIERDFEAVPELAALMADLLEEIDTLRARLRRAGRM
ncbi:chaperone modulator CbpM [Candidatus Macondimonas diazotrophica]|jgi:chaperone modulatory protein CbpM|uniref:MerR family transcriptional regulator n=1 Tax=Candidatus Macondimonas diazotrophica TaxID=2305248 RepID=A0A4Z0F8G5_9GAMM|nr:chaperone modulator CbpM [Candidatus Macondimonas diazotrophica]NCU00146.1 MerR family transcriptional regulator [Candidatus Macondimonas diazotrophica]TFZ81803.1 MerR family transcriptional regulator [Candidatus Macondimonas diazotrophica]HBG29339.1 MerR family transcriptional regulator [Gammaproteobacteria bacterium]HBG51361.1 MerR family transcriptional regulator [Gammaproteobacteria bacterium]